MRRSREQGCGYSGSVATTSKTGWIPNIQAAKLGLLPLFNLLHVGRVCWIMQLGSFSEFRVFLVFQNSFFH